MTGASFVTFFMYMGALAVFCVLICICARIALWWDDEKLKKEQREARKRHRKYLDSLEAKPWNRRVW